MSKRLAREIHKLYPGETRIISVGCSGLLDSGELLSSVVSITPAAGAPAASSGQVSASPLRISGELVVAGAALLFEAEHAGEDVGEYEYDIRVTTTAGQVISGTVVIDVQ